MSPYNYAENDPIRKFDPDGGSVYIANTKDQIYVLDQIRDQLGSGFFDFTDDGYLNYSRNAVNNAKEKIWTDDQIKLANGLLSAVKDDFIMVIRTYENENINFTRTPHISAIMPDDKDGIYKSNYSSQKNTKRNVFIENLLDEGLTIGFEDDDRAFVLINKAKAKTGSFSSIDGGFTKPVESSIFFHELLDEGKDYFWYGSPRPLGYYDINAVENMNTALRNCGSLERNAMDHGKFKKSRKKRRKRT